MLVDSDSSAQAANQSIDDIMSSFRSFVPSTTTAVMPITSSTANNNTNPFASASIDSSSSFVEGKGGDEEQSAVSSIDNIEQQQHNLLVEMEKRGKTSPSTTAAKRELIVNEHLFGHFGRDAIFKSLFNKNYWWPGMRQDIQTEIANCDACCRFVVTKAGYNPASFITADGPWHHVQLDTSTHMPPSPNGYTCLLVLIDVFTGFVLLRPIKTNSADIVANELWQVCCTFGLPKIVQSDNGPEFVNNVLRAMVNCCGIDHRLISPYNPRADGKVERAIGTVCSIIKKQLHGSGAHWPLFVPGAQLQFNNKVASLTNSSPFSLMFNRCMNEFKDYSTNDNEPKSIDIQDWKLHQNKVISLIYPAITDRINLRKDIMIKSLDKQRRLLLNNSYPTGAIVMLIDKLRANKWESKYVGPYSVIRRTHNGNYLLRELSTGELLDRHIPADQLKLISKKPRPIDIEGRLFEVAAILDHRGQPGNYQYYVKWKHFNDRTWEPAANFNDTKIINDYWKQVNEEAETNDTSIVHQ